MSSAEFDLQRAGTILLGKEVSLLLKDSAAGTTIRSIIANESTSRKLAIDMMTKKRLVENEFELKLQMINDFKTGLHLK